MPMLIAIEGPLKGQRFPLQEQLVVGRALESDIQINDLMVTRRHCLIWATPQGYMIEDLGSRNGTRLNDELLRAPTPLKNGDLIRVHNSVFRFVTMPEMDSAITVVDLSDQEPSTVVDAIDMASTMVTTEASIAPSDAGALAKAHQRLKTVVEIGNAVGAHLELDALLNEVMESFFRVFPQADRGFIMLRQPGSEKLQVKAVRQRDQKRPQTISVSRHIINEVLRQRIALLSADATSDARFADARSVLNLQIRSMMCAPLIASGELLGVVHLDTYRQDRRFTRDDLELFTSIASQIAMAVSQARMHEALRRRQRIEQELAMARHVQHSFLPCALPEIPGMEFAATYRAALEVGGDFYDFIPLSDGRLGIVLGDVMGKGMPAALMMVRMMSDVRFLAMSDPRPDKVLEQLNESLSQRGVDNAFVTMMFLLLDPATRKVSLANAGHWPPVLVKAAGGAATPIQGVEAGLAIGAVTGSRYALETVQLYPGDCLVLFTDGLTEAQNARDEMYGFQRLLAALSVPQPSVSSLMKHVLEDVRSFAGDTPQSDDLTMLCLGVKRAG